MSKILEIQQRLDRVSKLGKKMQELLTSMNKPETEAMKKQAKEHGVKMGIGVGISFLGLLIASVASVYILAVIILLVNIALDRLWLSALIVVGGFIFIGFGIIAAGASLASKSAKELSKVRAETTSQIKQTSEELKAEIAGLQEAAKEEAVELKGQLAGPAKIFAPTGAAAFVGFRVLGRVMSRRREKRMMMKVVRMVDEAREKERQSS